MLAASDQTDGRAISSMLTAGPAGAHLTDEINIASSPGHAFAMGCLAIASGLRRRVLVTSWGKASEIATEGGHAAAERLSADPYYERDAGVSPVAALGFQALAHRSTVPRAADAARAVVVKNRANGAANEWAVLRRAVDEAEIEASPVVAYPLHEAEIAAETDGVFALVLAGADEADRGEAVWVHGVGWSSDSSRLGERDLVRLPHLRQAARQAYDQAGVRDPLRELHLCEVHDASADAEVLAYEALGLCATGEGPELALSGATARDATLPVNPSGGSLSGEAPFGGGLRKILEAVRQLRGEAGGVQVHGAARALVQVGAGFAGQFQTVAVLGGEP